MRKSIQVLKPHFRVAETLDAIRECLEIGWTGIGYKTLSFEKSWSEYSGFRNSHFINSATSGLHLAVRLFKQCHGWRDGDEIITPSLTFVSTNHAILYEGLTPRFSDVDESLCLNPNEVKKLINKRTRAIMYVGLGGNAAHYREMRSIANENGLLLILDAAHMAGSRWMSSQEHIGLDSDCAIFSFQAVKNCPTSDSGMICFKDEELDRAVRVHSWMGIDKSTYDRYTESTYKWRYDVNELGFKYNGNSIAAAIAEISLKYLDQDNMRRRHMAELYENELKINTRIQMIRHDKCVLSSRHLFQIAVANRDQLMEKLAGIGIYCGVHYFPNHRYGLYQPYHQDLPITEKIADQLISLPLHLELTNEDVKMISTEILKAV